MATFGRVITLPLLPLGRERSRHEGGSSHQAHHAAHAPPSAPRTAVPLAGAPGPSPRRLIDSHHRTIRDLRLSITDRCNFRCVYCMEPDVEFLDRSGTLTVDEITRLARIALALGIKKIRLTGGEPTVHPHLTEIIANLAALGVPDLSMTTNGSLADDDACLAWKRAGLRRLTISLDTLRPDRFARLTRSKTSPDRVLAAIESAIRAGLAPVRVNAVVIRGWNEDEVAELAELPLRFPGVEMRFIEFMPLDSGHAWDPTLVVPADEIVKRISAVHPLEELGREDPSSTSLQFGFARPSACLSSSSPSSSTHVECQVPSSLPDARCLMPDASSAPIGIIAPVSRPFCGSCSRLRITADAKVRPCLFSTREFDLLPLLRSGAPDHAIEDFLIDATWTKQAGHGISTPEFIQPDRPMSAIGG